jgi:hypothetical protein
MDMDNAASILAGSILTGLAIIIGIATIVAINNILHRFWKPVNFGYFVPRSMTDSSLPNRFATEEELNKIAPEFDTTSTTTVVK